MLNAKDALKLARRRVPVFRLARGTKDRFIDTEWNNGAATADLVKVLERFSNAECNVGVWCGAGLLVVDIDAHHGGLEAWDALVQEIGPVPDTFTVRTPNGGLHLYFDRGLERIGQADLVKGKVNIRADGGYVVGPGSEFNGKPYLVEKELPIAPLPDNLRARLRARVALETPVKVVADLDTPASLERAELYLSKWAPKSDEGGRNNTLYKVVCQLGDLGLSEETALDFARRWNATHCNPPLDDGELEHTTQSAYRTRTAHIGRDAPGAGFTPVHSGPAPVEPPPAPTVLAVKWFEQTADTQFELEARPWIVPRKLIRGFVTGLIAPGGAGKSLLSIQWAGAIATNDPRGHGFEIAEATKVLIVNNEDPEEELERRAHAVFKGLGFDWAAARRRIGFLSGYGKPIVLVKKEKGVIEDTPEVGALIDFINANGIGVLILDPLISLHAGLNENDNSDMNRLISACRRIASETKCAILAVHHARKPSGSSSEGHAGNIDAGRGASAIKDAMRIGLTFFNMSEDDAERYGVALENRHRYVRLDETEKFNLGVRNPKPEWFERQSIGLDLKGGTKESLGYLRPVVLQEQDPDEQTSLAIVEAIGPHLEECPHIAMSRAHDIVKDSEIMKGGKDKIALRIIQAFNKPRTYNGKPISFLRAGDKGCMIKMV